MEEEYRGVTTCKVTIFGDFVTNESFSATVLFRDAEEVHRPSSFSRPLPPVAVGGQMLGQVNPWSDKAGLFLHCYNAFKDL